MASRLTTHFIRRVACVSDAPARIRLCGEFVAVLTTDERRHLLKELAELAGLRQSDAQVALLAVGEALGVARAKKAASPAARRAHRDLDDDTAEEVSPEPERSTREADWGLGRPLTLGERKNLARRSPRKLLDRALRDMHPDVVREVLVNPRLTEADVVRMCASPLVRPEVLERVFASPRWARVPRVRRAIAGNPAAPLAVAMSLVPLLARKELREIAADGRLPGAVRTLALDILRRLPPTPPGPAHLH